MADHFAATPTALLQYCKTRLLAAESLFETNVREISGLLFSHYLQTEHDEAHFWTKVKDGGVGAALDADKARLAEVTARASRGDRMEKGQ